MTFYTRMTGIVAAILLVVMGTQAATIANYGNWEGNDVWYNQVSENTEYGYYGEPTVTGNALSFDSTSIDANVNGGTMTNTAMLSFDILAKGDQYIAAVTFAELGNYIMGGFGNASVDVTANFTISVLEVNGTTAVSGVSKDVTMDFSPNADGTFSHPGGLSSTSGAWNGSILVDIGDILEDHSVAGDATLVNLSLENILSAESEAGTSAVINKSVEEALTITSTIIPEPASALLLVGAASCLTFIRRRFI